MICSYSHLLPIIVAPHFHTRKWWRLGDLEDCLHVNFDVQKVLIFSLGSLNKCLLNWFDCNIYIYNKFAFSVCTNAFFPLNWATAFNGFFINKQGYLRRKFICRYNLFLKFLREWEEWDMQPDLLKHNIFIYEYYKYLINFCQRLRPCDTRNLNVDNSTKGRFPW